MRRDLTKNSSKISLIAAAACVTAVSFLFFRFVKNIFLASDDSISNYIYAGLTDASYSFKSAMEFSLMRGKVGILFPLVTVFRDNIYRSGDLIAVRALQFVPLFANVVLTAVILERKLGKACAYLFVLFFFAFLQVTGWHNLVICYPLDFMYGLFMAQIALMLFVRWLNNTSGNRILPVLTALFFYASIQAYEAFALFFFVYVWIAVRKTKDIKMIIRRMIPVMISGAVFAVAGVILRIFPVVEVPDGYINEFGSAGYFFPTLAVMSGGLLPMTSAVVPSVREGMFQGGVPVSVILTALFAGGGVFFSFRLLPEELTSSARKALVTTGIAGVIAAVSFPAFHAAVRRYQVWVVEGHQLGYVPTLISYFGWMVFLTAMAVLAADRIKTKGKKIFVAAVTVLTVITALFTGLINRSIRDNGIGPASPDNSYMAQAIFALASDEGFAGTGCDLIYLEDCPGIHGQYLDYEYHFTKEAGHEITVTGSGEEYASLLENSMHPGRFEFDRNTGKGVFTSEDGQTSVEVFISK